MPNYTQLCGWHPVEKWDAGTRRSVRDYTASLMYPDFETSDAYAAIRGVGEGENVFLWEAERKVLGRILLAFLQTIGDCVSMGFGRASQDQMLIDIADRDEPERFPDELKSADWFVATEPIYAGSRVEIGGGRLSGDGSIGSWAARWVQEYGVLFRKKYDGGNSLNLTTYNGSKARDWGKRGVGCPDALEVEAREHPITAVSPCRSWEAFRDATATRNNVTLCSSQGFTTTRVDGFCIPSGTWNHCMVGRGVGVAKGNRPFGVIQQSWGQNNPSGDKRVRLENGAEVELPNGCFAVDAPVIDRMIRSGDCHVVSGMKGFRRQLKRDYANLI